MRGSVSERLHGRDTGHVTSKACSCCEDAIALVTFTIRLSSGLLHARLHDKLTKPWMTLDFPHEDHTRKDLLLHEIVAPKHDHVLILLRRYLSSPLLSSRPSF